LKPLTRKGEWLHYTHVCISFSFDETRHEEENATSNNPAKTLIEKKPNTESPG